MAEKYSRGCHCVAYGCEKRWEPKREEARNDGDGSDDKVSEMKRKYPRTFHL